MIIVVIIILLIMLSVLISTKGGTESVLNVRKATARDVQTVNKLLAMGDDAIYDKKMTVKKLKYLNREPAHGVYLGYIDGEPVATATIRNIAWGYESPQLSTTANVINPKYRGRGLMVDFSRAIFERLSTEGETAIRSQVAVDNIASHRVMEKLGFVREKEFEDHIFYRLDF